jgi:predicted DNA binding CopG/RHH family protein
MPRNKPCFANPATAFIAIPPKESDVPNVQSNRIEYTEENTVQNVRQNNHTEHTIKSAVYHLHRPDIKSQRLELRIRPSTLNNIKMVAAANKMSVNETVHQILDAFLDQGGGNQ